METYSLLEKVEMTEALINANGLGYNLPMARLYSIIEQENEQVSMTLADEHGDVYDLLANRNTLKVAKVSDYIVVVTCGWASPIDPDRDPNDDEVAPSQHPKRRRVRLVVMAGKEGMASALRFSDNPDEVITDDGNAVGSLASALHDLMLEAHL